jgi:hypothetical protein
MHKQLGSFKPSKKINHWFKPINKEFLQLDRDQEILNMRRRELEKKRPIESLQVIEVESRDQTAAGKSKQYHFYLKSVFIDNLEVISISDSDEEEASAMISAPPPRKKKTYAPRHALWITIAELFDENRDARRCIRDFPDIFGAANEHTVGNQS